MLRKGLVLAPILKSVVKPQKKMASVLRKYCKALIWSLLPPVWVVAPALALRQSLLEVAKELGILTVAVVTRPFPF